jgi:hypothetical protein
MIPQKASGVDYMREGISTEIKKCPGKQTQKRFCKWMIFTGAW